MKKLIAIVAVACSAFALHGATANWQVTANKLYDGTDSAATGSKYSGSIYFFDAGVISQQVLYKALLSGKDISTVTTGRAGVGATSTPGSINASSANFAYGTQGGNAINFYFACISGDMAYFSNILSSEPNGNDNPKTLAFSSQNNETTTFSTVAPEGSDFQGSGYWSSTVIPEPTSAMLMLLGFAGLALKRKRA